MRDAHANLNLVADCVKAVTSQAELETMFYINGNGLSISLKKR